MTRRGRSSGVLHDRTLKIVTWLILPVVICLSQRLSHACLSISNLYGETANGSVDDISGPFGKKLFSGISSRDIVKMWEPILEPAARLCLVQRLQDKWPGLSPVKI